MTNHINNIQEIYIKIINIMILFLTSVLVGGCPCAIGGGYNYTITNDSDIEVVICISSSFPLPEKRIHNLLDTIALVYEYTDFMSINFRLGSFEQYGYSRWFSTADESGKLKSNDSYNEAETDPSSTEYYTKYYEVYEYNIGIGKIVLDYKMYLRQDGYEFKFMLIEVNDDTGELEYIGHSSVNTQNIQEEELGVNDIETPNYLK